MTRKYTSLPYTEYSVATGHFDTNRAPIVKIVLHSSASDRQGLINTFGGGTRMVSAHYGIDNDGSILAFLEEYNTAYQAGNYAVNECSIGIEHIDNGPTVKLHTDQQYETSIKLVADICKFYEIPIDSLHIVPHSSIVATACPNGLDVNRIIDGAKILNEPIIVNPMGTDQTKYDFGGEWGVMELQQAKAILLAQKQKIDQLSSIPIPPPTTIPDTPGDVSGSSGDTTPPVTGNSNDPVNQNIVQKIIDYIISILTKKVI